MSNKPRKYCLHILFKESVGKEEINSKVSQKIFEIVKRNSGNEVAAEQAERRQLFYPIAREKAANYTVFSFYLSQPDDSAPVIGLSLDRIIRQIKDSFSDKILRIVSLKQRS